MNDSFDIFLTELDDVIEYVNNRARERAEEEEKQIKKQFAALQEEARDRLAAGPPQKRRALAIVQINGLAKAIDFDADEDIARGLEQYGRLVKRSLNSKTAWTLYSDYRYDFGEIVAYFKDLELVYDAGL